VAGVRAKILTAVGLLLLVGAGLLVVAAFPTVVTGSSEAFKAARTTRDGYPETRDQKFVGDRCTRSSTEVAGGTIVSAGGQTAAGGAGTGNGCGTFYAYELRGGRPTIVRPYVEPGLFLNPGDLVQPSSASL
jgi:hypothetical protein